MIAAFARVQVRAAQEISQLGVRNPDRRKTCPLTMRDVGKTMYKKESEELCVYSLCIRS